ncbi:MAG: MFS transporter [Bacteroidales bacterium]|nr:MFS transporter [Bacteroidales bacterium]MBR3285354.1 MFS transporter [Bacteroidales bacterium]MBR5432099.1 MFS transporter [Bacteroidales bacterium]
MNNNRNPWLWVPTLYFAEGLPYFLVNNISVIMFKNMGMSNGDLALYTSLLYLPWVIKPLWSPFVDVLKTKRWWIVTMQILMAAAFFLLALTLPKPSAQQIAGGNVGVSPFIVTLVIFYITALASATHDIAADGYYMIALDNHTQSVFVGIRSTFYRIASVFGQGVLVVIAGLLEKKTGNVPLAWTLTIAFSALLLGGLALWHAFKAPKAETTPEQGRTSGEIFRELGRSFVTFFQKKQVWFAMVFMLLYRLPEAFSVKMLNPFLLDSPSVGGLGLSTEMVGIVYGTVGVIALTLGGILGGLAAGRWGLRKSLWPMALSLALPCSVYLFMAIAQPTQIWIITLCVALDQFGYGFGFTAYMLYMMYFSEGEYKTSHYALCTAFMALSMMLPGLVAGHLQEALGYTGFFWMVMICCLATVFVTFFAKVDPAYGKKN